LKHYNSNVNDTIEGPELHAFVGDIARYLGLKLSLTVIEAGVTRVKVRFPIVLTKMLPPTNVTTGPLFNPAISFSYRLDTFIVES